MMLALNQLTSRPQLATNPLTSASMLARCLLTQCQLARLTSVVSVSSCLLASSTSRRSSPPTAHQRSATAPLTCASTCVASVARREHADLRSPPRGAVPLPGTRTQAYLYHHQHHAWSDSTPTLRYRRSSGCERTGLEKKYQDASRQGRV